MKQLNRIFIIFTLVIGLTSCGTKGDDTSPQSSAPTTPNVGTGGDVVFGQGPCSLIIIIQGNPTVVRADRGSTVTTGGVTIVFGPDCSSIVTPAKSPA